jgi:hypothetical protein
VLLRAVRRSDHGLQLFAVAPTKPDLSTPPHPPTSTSADVSQLIEAASARAIAQQGFRPDWQPDHSSERIGLKGPFWALPENRKKKLRRCRFHRSFDRHHVRE